MLRREFIHTACMSAAAGSLLSLAPVANAQQSFALEGRYEPIDPPVPTSNPDLIEVVEAFWYGCPHCNRFQPIVHPWSEQVPEHVNFIRLPAVFSSRWEAHARAYYVAESLGVLDKTHSQLFAAIHSAKQKLNSQKALAKFFAKHGIDEATFNKQYKSFAVDSGIRRSRVLQERYGLQGVPAIVVNGKYRITGSAAGSYENMIKVTEGLVEKEYRRAKTA